MYHVYIYIHIIVMIMIIMMNTASESTNFALHFVPWRMMLPRDHWQIEELHGVLRRHRNLPRVPFTLPG